jgi:sortase A
MIRVNSRRLLTIAALSVLAPAGLAACAGHSGSTTASTATSPTTSPTTATTGAAADPAAITATAAPSSTSTSTTIAVPTTTEALPVPAPAPAPHAKEPIVQLGTIEIPKIGVTASMFEGVSLTVLDHGPGHWPGSAMPGHTGNVVIAGHRTSHSKPFRNIDQLVPGDEVIFTTSDGRFVYEVTGTEVVNPTALRILDQTRDRTATLFACHPPGSTRQRIVVHLALVTT